MDKNILYSLINILLLENNKKDKQINKLKQELKNINNNNIEKERKDKYKEIYYVY